jgi:sRNA-binding carbon storage regulator CsrA
MWLYTVEVPMLNLARKVDEWVEIGECIRVRLVSIYVADPDHSKSVTIEVIDTRSGSKSYTIFTGHKYEISTGIWVKLWGCSPSRAKLGFDAPLEIKIYRLKPPPKIETPLPTRPDRPVPPWSFRWFWNWWKKPANKCG